MFSTPFKHPPDYSYPSTVSSTFYRLIQSAISKCIWSSKPVWFDHALLQKLKDLEGMASPNIKLYHDAHLARTSNWGPLIGEGTLLQNSGLWWNCATPHTQLSSLSWCISLASLAYCSYQCPNMEHIKYSINTFLLDLILYPLLH